MAIKTIAVDAVVYDRLAANKRAGESFSKAIDRLLTDASEANSGADILRRLEGFRPLADEEADGYMAVIEENRIGEAWTER